MRESRAGLASLRGAGWVFTFAAMSCSEDSVLIKLPTLPPAVRSILVISAQDGEWRVRASEVDDAPIRFEVANLAKTRLYVALYPHSLEALRLPIGELEVGTGHGSRTIPEPLAAMTLAYRDLVSVDGLPPAVLELRVRGSFKEPERPRAIAQVGVGGEHTCALRAEGTVVCWGGNERGELGQPTSGPSPAPLDVPGIVDAVHLAAAVDFTCIIDRSAGVRCWGEPSSGQLGRDEASDSDRGPKPIAGALDAVGVGLAWSHACLVRASGNVFCWGGNTQSAVDGATTLDIREPFRVEGVPTSVEVVSGVDHSCARTAEGEVWCWGRSGEGPIGTKAVGPAPSLIALPGKATHLVSGSSHVCARLEDDAVWCWGSASLGRIGQAQHLGPPSAPVETDLSRIPGELVAGGSGTCVLGPSGPTCGGRSVSGFFFDSDPIRDGLSSGLIGIALGPMGHACAVTTEGVSCWGSVENGKLGSGPLPERRQATEIPGLEGARSVMAAGSLTCVGRGSEATLCAGSNSTAMFAPSKRPNEPSLVPIGFSAVELAAGASHQCVRTSSPSASVVCSGGNGAGQLGLGHTSKATGWQLLPGSELMTQISAGELSACAVYREGELRCWGSNRYHKLGLDLADDYLTVAAPAPVELAGAKRVSIGSEHACAIAGANDSVWCWGENQDGQLATGSMGKRQKPEEARGLTGVVELESGALHSCARFADGSVSCWGYNSSGQVGGDVDQLRWWVPEPVASVADVVELAVGAAHTCVLTRRGTVECFGANAVGQLGDGGRSARFTPAPVLGLDDAEAISAGANHTCALRGGGKVSCWGLDAAGQLGLGTVTIEERPKRVPGLE
ncbi:MAG: hypothetical protein HYV07_34050 [Deltaproteobacteria bacterium]|nr:hypothetical protein [Deltaproteobacteria bacterium]